MPGRIEKFDCNDQLVPHDEGDVITLARSYFKKPIEPGVLDDHNRFVADYGGPRKMNAHFLYGKQGTLYVQRDATAQRIVAVLGAEFSLSPHYYLNKYVQLKIPQGGRVAEHYIRWLSVRRDQKDIQKIEDELHAAFEERSKEILGKNPGSLIEAVDLYPENGLAAQKARFARWGYDDIAEHQVSVDNIPKRKPMIVMGKLIQ